MARPTLERNPKWRRLLQSLGGDRALARGSLELLWDVAYESGDEVVGDQVDVELAAGWRGEPGALVKALLNAGGPGKKGFLEEVPEQPGRYLVHDLWDHAPDYVRKRRERELERRTKGAGLRQSADSVQSVTGQCPPFGAVRQESAPNGRPRTPAPAPAPAPARTPAARSSAGGRAKAKLGPLGAETVAAVARGLGHALKPLASQADADEFEDRIRARGGAGAAVEYFAATCRERDTEPEGVGLLLLWLRDLGPPAAALQSGGG